MYIYQADLYCDECGEAIKETLEYDEDSDKYPQYVHETNAGETDCPNHCASGSNCYGSIIFDDGEVVGDLLDQSLTPYGIEYVIATHKQRPTNITTLWMDTFGLWDEIETL